MTYGACDVLNISVRRILLTLTLTLCTAWTHAGEWKSLLEDGIHDPAGPAIGILQQPAEALGILPPDVTGNKVRWRKALEDGYINPRASLAPDTRIRQLDTNILMRNTGDLPYVLFPHKPHTEWLDCSNCHERIFKSKTGATPMTMLAILNGQYCGQCHGAVAFPLTECGRCHSVPATEAGNAASVR